MPRSSSQFKPGNPGRPKGSRNKFTTLKQAFFDAFNSQELGGVQGLINWAVKNRTEFYRLIIRFTPAEITGEDGEPLQIIVKTLRATDDS